ncbi:MAG: hypothetical protein LBD75_06505 [Candidatus Peribacteria bacterium]|nr:hypothetical protein [Candidatus Peribacteria bacterium]
MTALGGAGGLAPANGHVQPSESNSALGGWAYSSDGQSGTVCSLYDVNSNKYGAGGGGGCSSYPNGCNNPGSGGVTGGGNGGYGSNNAASNRGTNATFYGGGGGGEAFSSSHGK